VLATGLLIPLSLFLQFFFSVPPKILGAKSLSLSLFEEEEEKKRSEKSSPV
jgi:hypothetical protein